MKALVLLLTLSSALSLLSVNGNVYEYETEDAIIVEAAELESDGMYSCTFYSISSHRSYI